MNRTISFAFGLLLILPIAVTSVPRPAHAFMDGGGSLMLVAKEYGLDSVAWIVAKQAVSAMTRSTVNWINSGFNGSPAFITNLDEFLMHVGDVAAMAYIDELQNNPSLKSPFQNKIAQTAYTGYLLATSEDAYVRLNGYDLNQVTYYDEEFLRGNFGRGGWDAWFAAAMRPQNNPYGAQMLAMNGLEVAVSGSRNNRLIELNWGGGFMSWCDNVGAGETYEDAEGGAMIDNNGNFVGTPGSPELDAEAQVAAGNFVNTSQPNPAETCTDQHGNKGQIKTPGSVIRDQINHTLGLSGDQLVSADELNEIVSALMSQLTQQVMGAGGLSGVSRSSSGGRSYLDRAASDPAGAQAAAGTLDTAIISYRTQLQGYERDWETLNTQIEAASCSNDPVVTGARADYARAQAQISTAFTRLDEVQNLMSSVNSGAGGGGEAIGVIESASSKFQSIISSPPTAAEMARINAEAVDNSSSENGQETLYVKLEEEARRCR